jgi:hypothetical protein
MGEWRANVDLEVLRDLQKLYLTAQDIGGLDRVREHISRLVEPFDLEVAAILSVAGSRVGNSEALASCIAGVAPPEMMKQIRAGADAAEPASALWGFCIVLRDATRDRHDEEEDENEPTPTDAFEVKLAKSIVSDDVAETGRLLIAMDVNKTRISARNLPAKLLRKPEFGCPVLDVAVGSGAVEVTKFLLEFLRAKPTRETLKMALSSGNLELIRICWEVLPDEHEKERLDLLDVASDFHQLEVLSWLFRDADPFAKERFAECAILRHLADALLSVIVDGFRPWWAVAAAAKWAPTRDLEFTSAPDGFWPDGGWFTNMQGDTKGIRPTVGRWEASRQER